MIFDIEIPSQVVAKFDLMDPETEDVKFGYDLEPGMVVLVEPELREEDQKAFDGTPELTKHNHRTDNRWCRIEHFMPRRGPSKLSDIRWFIGVYADGTKATRMTLYHTGWVVKKSSIPLEKKVEELEPRPEWYQKLYGEITGYDIDRVDWTKVTLEFPRGDYPRFNEETGLTTWKSWAIPMKYWDELDKNMREF